MSLTSVRVSERTAWMFVHLRTNRGLAGLGECSVGNRRELPALNGAFEAARGRSPFDIEAYRAAGRARPPTSSSRRNASRTVRSRCRKVPASASS